MSKLLIEVDAPYLVELYIDEKQYSPNEKGIYTIELEPNTEHDLRVNVINESVEIHTLKKNKFSKRVTSKIGKIKSDIFYNVYYNMKFSLPISQRPPKIVLQYNKEKLRDDFYQGLLYKENNYTNIPYLKVFQIKGVNIIEEKESLFNNKFEVMKYVILHRIFLPLLYLLGILVYLNEFLESHIDYLNGIEYYEYRRFSGNTPKSNIIISFVFVFIIVIVFIVDNYLYFKRLKKIMNIAKKYLRK